MEILFGASIIVSFIAGMLALFAPCCITFLLPVYLANIFRSKTKIFLSTLIFTLGIATVILPLSLGFKIILEIFFENHSVVYYIGSLLMILFGVLTLLKVDLFHFNFKILSPRLNTTSSNNINQKVEFGSLYMLGVVSGISTACCAPVLAGAVVLAGISPQLFQTILVALSYTSGIVFPLFLGVWFLEKNKYLNSIKNFFDLNVGKYTLGNLISALLMIGAGVFIFVLNYKNKIGVGETSEFLNQSIGQLNLTLGNFLAKYQLLDFVLGVLILVLIFLFIYKNIKNELNKKG